MAMIPTVSQEVVMFSDSASLGSNPSPPASQNPAKQGFHALGHIGPDGTGSVPTPHKSRHRVKNQIKRLFDSRVGWGGFGSRNVIEAYDKMTDPIMEGRLTITPHRVQPLILQKADRKRAQRYSQSRGEGGLSHCWLKEIGLLWLGERFLASFKREVKAFGCRYDVGFEVDGGGAVLECGNTSIQSALIALEMDWCYFLLPFSPAADRWFEEEGKPKVFVFEFQMRDPQWRDAP